LGRRRTIKGSGAGGVVCRILSEIADYINYAMTPGADPVLARSVSSQDVCFIWFDHWQNWQVTLTRSTSKMVGDNGGNLYLNPPILANAGSRNFCESRQHRLNPTTTTMKRSFKRRNTMPAKNPKEVFVMLLSDARQNTERSAELYREISQLAQNPDVREALEARAFITDKNLEALDQCFELIGEEPVKLSGRLHEVFVEDFKRELAEIQSPAARHLYVLARATHLAHLRFAEYAMLIAAADISGHYGVGVLLESVLADKLAFLERTRRLVRHIIEGKIAERLAA
jgi:ferritin-like metal-binding protein YciE